MQGNAGSIGSRGARLVLALAALFVVSLAGAATALAAPPANDTRAGAQQISLGERVTGSTAEATSDEDDQTSGCGPSDTPSVWYQIDGTRNGRTIVQLQANGDLDAVIDVYSRQRSQFSPLNCDVSDESGRASTDFDMANGQSYLIRVSQQEGSLPGDFTLTVNPGQEPASAPGRPLPRGGVRGSVQRLFEPSNAYSTRMKAGRSYRINLSPESCMRLSIYGPGADSFDETPVRTLRCGGYTVFTPGPDEGGVYSLLIEPASSRRTPQSYHLQVSRAGRDDIAPGKFVRNHQRVRGKLNAERIDVVDLYRFDVTGRSITDLVLSSDSEFSITLVTAKGRRIQGGGDNVHVRTKPGRYFVAVRAARHATGSYTLARASKTITRTRLSVSPRRSGPGSSVNLGVNVAPGASGPVTIVVERFDPLTGWSFLRRFKTRASGGRASVAFRPPSVGRYRAQATFEGTRIAAGSRSGVERFRVQAPLRD
jgi:hypothetical protein